VWRIADEGAKMERGLGKTNAALIGETFLAKGVSLSYLKTLKVDPLEDFEAVQKHIKELTKDTKGNRSLVSHLVQNSSTEHWVGPASYFVSHAWGASFGDTMAALTSHFEEKETPFLWMSIFMMDQHASKTTKLDFNAWSGIFEDCLRKIGKSILVLLPAEDPIAIKRSWCCYEWYCIKKNDIPFEYCVNPKNVEALVQQMASGEVGFATFQRLFASINVEKASSTNEDDRIAILERMRQIGIKEVNEVILHSVQQWLLFMTIQSKKRVKQGTKEGTNLLNAKASLHFVLVSSRIAGKREMLHDN
jgi:hypothetical protein